MAFREVRRREDLEDYRHRTLIWAITAPWSSRRQEPPEMSELLKELLK